MSIQAGIILTIAVFVAGALLAARAGIRSIQHARKVSFFRLRRSHMVAGWKWLLLALFLFSFSVASALVGEPVANQFFPPTPGPTATLTSTLPPTMTLAPSKTYTVTPPLTPTIAFTPTPTASPTFTATVTPSQTPSPTLTATLTSTLTPSQTLTRTNTPLPTATTSRTPTQTPAPTQDRNATSTAAVRMSQTARAIAVLSQTPTKTARATPTVTESQTPSPVVTVTPSQTVTPTASVTPSKTETPTLAPQPTLTFTPTSTATQIFTATASSTPTLTRTPSLTATNTASATPVETMSQTPTGTPTLTLTPTNIPTSTATPTSTPTRTAAPSLTATMSRTPTPDRSCDRIELLADVNVPKDSVFAPGSSFTKVWRLKNVGTCNWRTSYRVVLVDGDSIGAQNSMPLPAEVAPGQTIDLSMNFTAPRLEGTYQGNWQLRNDKGEIFNMASTANRPFSVSILVKTPPPTGSVYDFVSNGCSALWVSGSGTLTCPGTNRDPRGFVLRQSLSRMENGTTIVRPSLLTVPQTALHGYIRGVYPPFKVQTGDRFRAIANCETGATACRVLFRLDYQIAGEPVQQLWEIDERYDGNSTTVDIDLSSLAGQDVKFTLTVLSLGTASGDRALWVEPRITRGGRGPSVTSTPTP